MIEGEEKKGLDFLPAFGIAIAATLLVSVAFGLLGLTEDPLLLQIGLLVVTICFCLTGILTRSKLKGLAGLLVAPFAWAPAMVGIPTPYGLGTTVGKGVWKDAIDALRPLVKEGKIEGWSQSDLDQYKSFGDYFIFIDLIILLFLALTAGFFLSMIATGFFKKDGSISIIALIAKPIAVIFVLLLMLVPISYHGVLKTGEFAIAFTAGAATLSNEAETMGDVNIDDLETINTTFKEAKGFFEDANDAFDHVKANFIFSFIANHMTISEDVKASDYLDIADNMLNALVYITGACPNLFSGIAYLTEGMDETFEGMGMEGLEESSTASDVRLLSANGASQYGDLDEATFKAGLVFLEQSMTYFGRASVDVDKAFQEVFKILESKAFQELTEGDDEAAQTVDDMKTLEGLITELAIPMGQGAIDFVNATFYLLLGVQHLSNYSFVKARQALGNASVNFGDASGTLGPLRAGLDPALKDSDFTNPIWGGINAFADMTLLINDFVKAAYNGTTTLEAIDNTLTLLSTANMTEMMENPLGQDISVWNPALNYLATATTAIGPHGAEGNIANASTIAKAVEIGDYGQLNETMHILASDLLGQVGRDDSEGFWALTKDIGVGLNSSSYLNKGLYSFGRGFAYWNVANDSVEMSPDYISNMTAAADWFNFAELNSSLAGDEMPGDVFYDNHFQELPIETETTLIQISGPLELAGNVTESLARAAADGSQSASEILGGIMTQLGNVESSQDLMDGVFEEGQGGSILQLQQSSPAPRMKTRLPQSPTRNPEVVRLLEILENHGRFYVPFFIGLVAFAFAVGARRKR